MRLLRHTTGVRFARQIAIRWLGGNSAGAYCNSNLLSSITEAIKRAGIDSTALTLQDLAPIDQFHVGGAEGKILQPLLS